LTYLLTAILNHPNLHTVNLSDNAFGSTAQVPLISFLSAHIPLEHLILANNGLGPEAGSNIAQALATLASAKHFHSKETDKPAAPLKTVICGRNRLGDASMSSWAKCYSMNTAIETIRMPQNGIRPDDIIILLRDGIVHNKTLKVLDLQDNTFTARGSRALAAILPELTELTDLGIGDCLLSNNGGVAIAQALAQGKNQKLEFLRLQYNELTERSAGEFVSAVKSSLYKLKRIELNGNKFLEEDPFVEELRDIFRSRGYGELDELDDLEEPDSEEEEEEEVSAEEEELHEEHVRPNAAREVINKQVQDEEDQEVAPEEDKDTDELAEALAKTHIKE
jgi:Ran GTPase-activating protein 1